MKLRFLQCVYLGPLDKVVNVAEVVVVEDAVYAQALVDGKLAEVFEELEETIAKVVKTTKKVKYNGDV